MCGVAPNDKGAVLVDERQIFAVGKECNDLFGSGLANVVCRCDAFGKTRPVECLVRRKAKAKRFDGELG